MISDKDIERFWSKVDIRNTDGCWNWIASKNKKGYGEFYLKNVPHLHAHQISWMIVRGNISNGMCVLHKCDNPSCVNPTHLFLGTNQDNVNDKMTKGRWKSKFLYGKNHPQHGTNSKFNKLSDSDVLKIRELKAQGNTLRGLAKQFGVSHGVINNIIQKRKWSWLP